MHGLTQRRSLGVHALSLIYISVSAAAPIPVRGSRTEEFQLEDFLSGTREMLSR